MHAEYLGENQAEAKPQSEHTVVNTTDERIVETSGAKLAEPHDLTLSTAMQSTSEPTMSRTSFGPSFSLLADFSTMPSTQND